MADWEDEPDTSVERRRGAPRPAPTNGARADLETTVGLLMGGLSRLERDVSTLTREVTALTREVREQRDESREHTLQAVRRTARYIGTLLVVGAVVYNELRPVLVGLLHHGH